ncbi:MAG: hypothetical protein FWF04_01530, partial [Clostridiales bacterium]|nr:hypothetical protein [Clostridiales bacterium]
MDTREKKKKAKPRRKKTVRLWSKLLLLALFAVLSAAILSVDIMPPQITFAVGDVADADLFYSDKDVDYVSDLLTGAARDAAASQVERVFSIDETVLPELISRINADFKAVEELRNNTTLEAQDRLANLSEKLQRLPDSYEDELLEYVLEASFGEVYGLRQALRNAVNTVYDKGVRNEDLLTAKAWISALLDESAVDDIGKRFMHAYLDNFTLLTNEYYDDLATEAAKEEARKAVREVLVRVQNREKLLSKGTVITAEQIEALQKLGKYRDDDNYMPYFGLLGIVLLLFILLTFYLYYYQPKLFAQDKSVLLLGVIMVLVLLLSKFIAYISFSADN